MDRWPLDAIIEAQQAELREAVLSIGVDPSELQMASGYEDGERWVEARHAPSGASGRASGPETLEFLEDADRIAYSVWWRNLQAEAFRRLKVVMERSAEVRPDPAAVHLPVVELHDHTAADPVAGVPFEPLG